MHDKCFKSFSDWNIFVRKSLSQKPFYFSGSHYSQYFILSTTLRCTLPSNNFVIFRVITKRVYSAFIMDEQYKSLYETIVYLIPIYDVLFPNKNTLKENCSFIIVGKYTQINLFDCYLLLCSSREVSQHGNVQVASSLTPTHLLSHPFQLLVHHLEMFNVNVGKRKIFKLIVQTFSQINTWARA